jgi:hypothetical protein
MTGRVAIGILALLGTTALLAGVAHAGDVFHSPYDDGIVTCAGLSPCPFVNEVNLWVVADPPACSSGGTCTSLCSDVCGVDALIEVEGGSFESLSFEAGVTHEPKCLPETSCTLPTVPATTTLHVVSSFASQSATTGPRRLGRIVVVPDASGPISVSVNGIQIVDSEVQVQGLPTRIVSAPEPTATAMLVSGGALLFALRRRARRRGR